jgi:hypothetical protein
MGRYRKGSRRRERKEDGTFGKQLQHQQNCSESESDDDKKEKDTNEDNDETESEGDEWVLEELAEIGLFTYFFFLLFFAQFLFLLFHNYIFFK